MDMIMSGLFLVLRYQLHRMSVSGGLGLELGWMWKKRKKRRKISRGEEEEGLRGMIGLGLYEAREWI